MLLLLYTPGRLNDVLRSISPLQLPPILYFLLYFGHPLGELLEFSQPNGCLIPLLPFFGVGPSNPEQLGQLPSMLEHDVVHLPLKKVHGLNFPFATLNFFVVVDEIPFDKLLNYLRCIFLEIENVLEVRPPDSFHPVICLEP